MDDTHTTVDGVRLHLTPSAAHDTGGAVFMGDEKSNNVQVVCRLRPQNQKEEAAQGEFCWNFTAQQVSTAQHSFTFDHVLGPQALQEDVYKVVAPIVEDVRRVLCARVGW